MQQQNASRQHVLVVSEIAKNQMKPNGCIKMHYDELSEKHLWNLECLGNLVEKFRPIHALHNGIPHSYSKLSITKKSKHTLTTLDNTTPDRSWVLRGKSY